VKQGLRGCLRFLLENFLLKEATDSPVNGQLSHGKPHKFPTDLEDTPIHLKNGPSENPLSLRVVSDFPSTHLKCLDGPNTPSPSLRCADGEKKTISRN
jgi:hypothetical protein